MKDSLKYKFIITLLFIIVPSISFSKTPVIFFSDMTDGPTTGWEKSTQKGAAVSIWGLNFGNERNTSFVTVGGVELKNDTDYGEWGATTNPKTARNLQRITFYLNSSMVTSGVAPNSSIVVTTQHGQSTSVPFHCRALNNNHIYFIDDTGDDNLDGLTKATAWKNLRKIRETLVAGDAVYVREGIYTTIDTQYAAYKSLLYCVDGNYNNGRLYNSITVAAYPGEVAQMGNATDTVETFFRHNHNSGGKLEHWTFSKIKNNTYHYAMMLTNSPHRGDESIRIIGFDATTHHATTGKGMILMINAGGLGSNNMSIYGNYLHHAGKMNETDPHGYKVESIYFMGFGKHHKVDIGWNEMYNNNGTVQFYGHFSTDKIDTLLFHDNLVHENGTATIIAGGGDGSSTYNFVENAYIYNNIFANNEGGARLTDGSTGSHGGNFYLYNNTFFGNCRTLGWREFTICHEARYEFINNLIVTNPLVGAYFYSTENPSSYLLNDNNCWFGKGNGPSFGNNNLNDTDPLLKNLSPNIFEIDSNSKCKDAGKFVALTSFDFNGVKRLSHNAFDIGAVEYNINFLCNYPSIPSNFILSNN